MISDLVFPAFIVVFCALALFVSIYTARRLADSQNAIPKLNERSLTKMTEDERGIFKKMGVRLLSYDVAYQGESSLFTDDKISLYTGERDGRKVVLETFGEKVINPYGAFKIRVYFKNKLKGNFLYTYNVGVLDMINKNTDLLLLDRLPFIMGKGEKLRVKGNPGVKDVFFGAEMSKVLDYLKNTLSIKFVDKSLLIENGFFRLSGKPLSYVSKRDLKNMVEVVKKMETLFDDKVSIR